MKDNDYIQEILKLNPVQVREDIYHSLKKMSQFLINQSATKSFHEIKSYPRITIDGNCEEDGERILFSEIKKDFDIDMVEDSIGFNTFYPPNRQGVIVDKINNDEIYYEYYEVAKETDDTFSLLIVEYCFSNRVYYPSFYVYVADLTKKGPGFSYTDLLCFNMDKFLYKFFSSEELNKELSEEDLDNIRIAALANATNHGPTILFYVLGTFRVYNFLSEIYDEKKITNNDYFRLQHWDIIEITEEKNEQSANIEKINSLESGFTILDTHSLKEVLQTLVTKNDVKNVYIAVGFAFLSGIKALEKAFKEVYGRNGKVELIIGALQYYDNGNVNNRMDRNSAAALNALLANNWIKLYTNRNAFYHGKFYYLGCTEKAYIIVGSSNISKSAFADNIEFDILHVMKRESPEEKQFLNWYKTLRDSCDEINHLDESNFRDFNWNSELDAFSNLKYGKVSKETIQKKIDALTDEELKFRLNLWMNKNPTEIYEDLNIEALMGYTMFVYAANQIISFESFVPGNAYYVFRYNSTIEKLVSDLSDMSKTQMTLSEHYVKRGNHGQNREKIERRINRFFE